MGLLARMVRHLQDEAEYEVRVDEFMKEHVHYFRADEDLETEQSLEKFAVFRKYSEMVDGILQSFCDVEGFASAEDLVAALQVELKGKPLSRIRGSYIKAILTDTTYEGFLTIMLEYAGWAKASTPGGEASPLPAAPSAPLSETPPTCASTGQEGPYAGWTVEEATALSHAGLLPRFPSPGEMAWGFYPDGAGSGRWLPVRVDHMLDDGSAVQVTWIFSAAANTLPAGHVQSAPASGEAVWGFLADGTGGGQWLHAVVQQMAADGTGIEVIWQHDGSCHILPYEYVQRPPG